MKPRQESRAPAKNVPQASKAKNAKVVAPGNTVKAAAAAKTSQSSSRGKTDFDDVADLFSAIKQTKAQQKGIDVSAAGTSRTGKRNSASTSSPSSKGSSTGGASASSSAGASATAKPVRDGLYHAPQKSVQMSDNVFFSGTWLKADQEAPTEASIVAGGGSTEASQEMLRQEGVDRIVSMEELSKMLSRSSRAGTTPNCPFDCDCCF